MNKNFIKQLVYSVLKLRRGRKLSSTHASLEQLLLAGKVPQIKDHQSVILFTTWKCGSVITDKIVRMVASQTGLKKVDYQGYIEHNFSDPFDFLKSDDFLSKRFHPKGFFYSPIKFWLNIPNISKFKVIVQLRDPKDVMTSMYYSFAHSHAIINENARKTRDEFLASDIDTIALKYGREFYEHSYQPYMQLLQHHNNALFLKYEDMVTDFPRWLQKLCDFLDVDLTEGQLAEIYALADFKVDKENIQSHKRAVQPGNFRKHLAPETVEKLNIIFREVNVYFGYQ